MSDWLTYDLKRVLSLYQNNKALPGAGSRVKPNSFGVYFIMPYFIG